MWACETNGPVTRAGNRDTDGSTTENTGGLIYTDIVSIPVNMTIVSERYIDPGYHLSSQFNLE